MLKVEETVRQESDWLYKYSYRINQDGIYMNLATDDPETRNALDLEKLEKKDTKLKYYISRKMLDILRNYKCNYYIDKLRREIDISFYGDHFTIMLEGYPVRMCPSDSTDKIYKKMKKIWRKL